MWDEGMMKEYMNEKER